MHQYRQVLVRMRMGESYRAIANSGLMGRNKLRELRAIAQEQGWLASNTKLPADEQLALVLKKPVTQASATSLFSPITMTSSNGWTTVFSTPPFIRRAFASMDLTAVIRRFGVI